MVTGYRAALALLTLFAIGAQVTDLTDKGTFTSANFFSYFTIQTNLLGAAVFLFMAVRGNRPRPAGIESVRGASVTYLMVVLVTFALLLSGSDVDLAIPWVDTILHRVFPVVVLADWLIDPPRCALTLRHALVWTVYPLVYTAYSLVRGGLVGWYPYPFLNPANGGYGSVAAHVAGISAFALLVGVAVVWVGNVRARVAESRSR